jgi:hypothetical protein
MKFIPEDFGNPILTDETHNQWAARIANAALQKKLDTLPAAMHSAACLYIQELKGALDKRADLPPEAAAT